MATDTTRVSSYIRSEGFKDSAGTLYQYASAVNNLVSGLTASANYSALSRMFSGLTASCEASQINNLFSGLASTVTAGMITGYTLRAATADGTPSATYAVSASTAAYATSADYSTSGVYAASAAYAVSATTAAYSTSAAYAVSAATAANAATAVTAAAATTALAAASASYAASAGTLSGVTATAGRINALMYSTAAHKSVYGSTAITASATIGVTALGLTTLAAFVYTKTVSCIDYMTFTTTGVVISLMSGTTAATGSIYFMAIND